MYNFKPIFIGFSVLMTSIIIIPQGVHASDISLLTKLETRVDRLKLNVEDFKMSMTKKDDDDEDRDEQRDRTAPLVENIVITADINYTIVSWTTNEPTKGTVRYGVRKPLKPEHSVRSSSELSLSHKVKLINLKADTTYKIVIIAHDKQGNKAKTDVRTFTTLKAPIIPPDITAPNVLFESALLVKTNSAHVLWVTNEKSNGRLWLSTSPTINTNLAPARLWEGNSLFHDIELTDLTPGTTYFYIISSTDASGNVTMLSAHSFQTTAN